MKAKPSQSREGKPRRRKGSMRRRRGTRARGDALQQCMGRKQGSYMYRAVCVLAVKGKRKGIPWEVPYPMLPCPRPCLFPAHPVFSRTCRYLYSYVPSYMVLPTFPAGTCTRLGCHPVRLPVPQASSDPEQVFLSLCHILHALPWEVGDHAQGLNCPWNRRAGSSRAQSSRADDEESVILTTQYLGSQRRHGLPE